jgi:hypothetical protein
MSRIFGADVLDKVHARLTAELNIMIDTISEERSVSGLAHVKKINFGAFERQFPECLITIDNSEIDMESISSDIMQTSEEWPLEVVVVFKDVSTIPYHKQEYYIEALARVLNGYSDEDITWILVNGSVRVNMYTESKETFRVVGVTATVRTL